MKKRILLLILTLAIVVLPLLSAPIPAFATEPWITGWGYRQLHYFTGAATAGTGYQMRIVVHSGAGVDTGNTVYLDGGCTNFPEDITFADNDKTTELHYFCENLAADPAIFWVEVSDDLSSGTVPAYLYYGKAGQDSQSNGIATFPGLYDGWDLNAYGSWSTGASLPTVRYTITINELPFYNGKMYIIGGWDASLPVPSNTIYTVATNTYSSGANYPAAGIASASQVLYNGKIYCFGGVVSYIGYVNYLRIYDIASNTWSSGASVPWAGEGMLVAADPTTGLIYVGGGCQLPVAMHDEWYAYNTVTNTWSAKAVMPHTRGNGATFYYNGNIYTTAGGGITGTTLLNTTWRYNIAANTWTTNLATLSTPVVVASNGLDPTTGRIYLFGGRTSAGATYTNVVQVYDIDADVWLDQTGDYSFAAMPASYGFASGAFNGTSSVFYMFGGWDQTTIFNILRKDDLNVATAGGIDAGKWNYVGATVASGILTIDLSGDYLQSKATFLNKALVFRSNTSSVMANSASLGFQQNLLGTLDNALFTPRAGALAWAFTEKAADYQIDVISTFYDAYHTFDIGRTSVNITYRQDNAIVATVTNTTCVPLNALAAAFVEPLLGNPLGPPIRIDWAFVRKFVDPEPSHGGWGAVEDSPYLYITTEPASRIAATTARLNSILARDGSLPVTVRFGWGNSTQAAIIDYDHFQTLPGTYAAGAHPYLDITGLNISVLYYFRVEGTNANGVSLGAERTFTTTPLTGTPQNFKGIPSSDSISLSWDTLFGASRYLIMYKFGSYPTGTTDGTQVYFGTSTSTVHTGLTPGKTYYYMLWGESGGAYSSNATLMLTTTAGTGPGASASFIKPPAIERWLTGTDYTNVASLGFIYTIVNNVAGSVNVPYATAWFLLSAGLSVIIGLIVLVKSRGKLMVAVIAMTVMLTLGWMMKLVPFWIPLIGGIIIIASFVGHRDTAKG